jgi:hypothetical protein
MSKWIVNGMPMGYPSCRINRNLNSYGLPFFGTTEYFKSISSSTSMEIYLIGKNLLG